MSKFRRMANLLKYVSEPLEIEDVNAIFKANSIDNQKSELFHDFIISLAHLISDTYLGDKYHQARERPAHFKWCWDKTIKNFNEEDIHFKPEGELQQYFYTFIMEEFYLSSDKEKGFYVLIKTWDYLFSRKYKKTRSELDTYLEIYKIFNKSFKKGSKT
jgi:hypothetical protein|tara:strand:- start:753 stop:1229 length:477 start_codon:yes stop_codon:yes gene_type:complete